MISAFDTGLRKYATQATVALSLVVGITGVMMFFNIAKGEVEGMHEWLGMAFAIAAILHVLRHRGAFAAMLDQPRMRVLFAAAAVAAALFLALTPPKQGNPMRDAGRLLTSAPLEEVAPLLDISAAELAARLNTSDTTQSMEAIAASQGGNPMHLLGKAMGRP